MNISDNSSEGRRNLFNKNIPASVEKGSLIGIGIGAISQLGMCLLFMPKENKDTFEKSILNNAERHAKESGVNVDEYLKTVKERIPKLWETYKTNAKNYKNQIPAIVIKSAGILGVIGAGIGLIVHLVKNSKAKKEQVQQNAK